MSNAIPSVISAFTFFLTFIGSLGPQQPNLLNRSNIHSVDRPVRAAASTPIHQAFLRFLYSGTLEGSLSTLVEVVAIADKYQVSKLSRHCAFDSSVERSPFQDSCCLGSCKF